MVMVNMILVEDAGRHLLLHFTHFCIEQKILSVEQKLEISCMGDGDIGNGNGEYEK